jgi:anti-sigma factor RsiW
MTREELEFSISRYVDGTLPDGDRATVGSRLIDDPEAQALAAEDRALTNLLRSSPLPNVRWDRLAESISQAIDQHLEDQIARASWWMRHRIPAGLAVAASALLAIGIVIRVLAPGRSHVAQPGIKSLGTQTVAMLTVEGPHADTAAGPEVTQISIGAGGSYATDSALAPYADEIDTRPARIVIASGLTPNQPRAGFPY